MPLDHCDPTSDATQRNRPWSLDERCRLPGRGPAAAPTTIKFLFLVFCIFMVRLYFKRHARCVRVSTPNFIPKQDTPTATHSLWSRSSARPGCWDCDARSRPLPRCTLWSIRSSTHRTAIAHFLTMSHHEHDPRFQTCTHCTSSSQTASQGMLHKIVRLPPALWTALDATLDARDSKPHKRTRGEEPRLSRHGRRQCVATTAATGH